MMRTASTAALNQRTQPTHLREFKLPEDKRRETGSQVRGMGGRRQGCQKKGGEGKERVHV